LKAKFKAKFGAKFDHAGHWDNPVSERNHHHTIFGEKKGIYFTHPSRDGPVLSLDERKVR
jgi:hypothetical protein